MGAQQIREIPETSVEDKRIFSHMVSRFFLRPDKLFLLLGTLYGILFLFIVPPFQGPDEMNHFYRAYQISEGRLIAAKRASPILNSAQMAEREEKARQIRNLYAKGDEEAMVKFYDLKNMGGIGGLLPKSLAATTNAFIRLIHPENKQRIDDIAPLFTLPLSRDSKIFLHFPNTAVYSPIPYLPQALGIETGKIFDLSPLLLMYLGRFFNLLTWVTLVYLSIRRTPAFKWGVFLLALTPMSLAEASSLSADGLTMGVSFFLITLIAGTALNESEVNANIFLILLVSIVLALCKQAYFFAPLLFLLIPAKKIGSKKKFFAVFLLLNLLTISAVLIWTLKADIYKDMYKIYGFLVPTLSPQEQFSFILSHPLEYCKILASTLLQNGRTYIETFLGYQSQLLTIFYIIMFFFTILGEASQEIAVSCQKRAIIFLSLSLGVLAVLTLSYMGWTPVGDKVVGGVQGRYFIPLSPLFLLLFCRRKSFFWLDKVPSAIIYSFFSAGALTHTLFAIYKHFYI